MIGQEDIQLLNAKMANLLDYLHDYTVTIISGQFSEAFINYNLSQLFDSQQANGLQIEYTYSLATVKLSEGKVYNFLGQSKQKGYREPFFLLDTGQFYDSFKIVNKNNELKYDADTQKDDTNLLEFGDLLGLTEENANELTEKLIEPELVRVLRDSYFNF